MPPFEADRLIEVKLLAEVQVYGEGISCASNLLGIYDWLVKENMRVWREETVVQFHQSDNVSNINKDRFLLQSLL